MARHPGSLGEQHVWFAPGNRARRFASLEGDWVKGTGGRLRATADSGATWADLPLPGGAGAHRILVVDAAGDNLFASRRGLDPGRALEERRWRPVVA